MRVLVAPDSFTGTLTAAEAAAAIADGWRARRPNDVLDVVPVADGGLGTVDVLAHLGTLRTNAVEDAYGRRVEARWLLMDGTAYVESATACGLDPEVRDPLRATTAGVGELVCAALGEGVRNVVVGVGGTASCDGGAGMAQAVGAWLLDANGHPLDPGGAALARLARVSRDDLDPRLANVTVTAAADVEDTLDEAVGYAPQKGASDDDVTLLRDALRHYASVVGADASLPGTGAGGGLAYGLHAFCGATITPGASVVLDLLRFAKNVAKADLVVTGEGAFD